MDRKFPKLLTNAVIRGSKLFFYDKDIDDESLVEFLEWKSYYDIEVLRPSRLLKFYRQGAFKEEIRALYKKNNKIKEILNTFDRVRKSA